MPNVLLITADQMRGDALGCMGNQVIQTPNLDALAASGVLFRRGYTSNPICVPARACITTGNYSHRATGFKNNHGCIRDGQCKIAEFYARAGYATYALGKLHYVPYAPPGQPRLLHGFQHAELAESGRIQRCHDPSNTKRGIEDYFDYLDDVGWRAYTRAHGIGNNDLHSAPSPLPQEHCVDSWVASRTIAALRGHLERRPAAPFFAWMSFPKPHSPYDPPRPYDSLYDPRRVPAPFGNAEMLKDRNPFLRISAANHGVQFFSPQAIQVMRAYYYGLVTFQDKMVGRVMEFLRETGVWDDTIIVYTADHGDLIGDFGGCFKCNFLEGSVHVPFIIRAPGRAPSGRVNGDLVGLQDILPTLASLCGLELPAPADGRDLSATLAGRGGVRDVYISQCMDAPKQAYMAVDSRWKYCYAESNGVEELYDLANDPHELLNLAAAGEAKDHALRLRREIVRWCAENGDRAALDGDDLRRTDLDVEPKCHFSPDSMGWRWT